MMFLKISKGCLTASTMLCSALLYAQNPTISGDVKRSVSIEEILHDERFTKAEESALKAGEFFEKEDYQSAIDEYMQAWKGYDATGKSDYLTTRINNCRKMIAECYKQLAAKIANEADANSAAGDFDKAVENANKAKAMDATLTAKMDAAISKYNKQKVAITTRVKASDEVVVPNYKEVDARIESLLTQAKALYRNGKIVEAKEKYNDVIILDRTNITALRGRRACNLDLIKAGNIRSTTASQKIMVEAAAGYAVPIRKIGDAEYTASMLEKPQAKQSGVKDDLSVRLPEIILSEIILSGQQLPEALSILMEEARNNDPSGKGANIVLIWPDGYYVDAYGTPVQGPSTIDMPDKNAANATGAATGRTARRTPQRQRNTNNAAGPAQIPTGMGPAQIPMGAGGMPGMGGMAMPGAGFAAPTIGGGYGTEGLTPEEIAERKYPKIALNMSNVPLNEVIMRICRQAGLKFKVDSNAVVIAPKNVAIGDMEIKLFPLKREALLATNFSDSHQLMIFFGSHGILFPLGSSIVYDWRNSRLIVNNTADNLDKIEKLIETQLNVKDVQVQLQAKFVEVTQNDVTELGFEYALSRPLTGESTNGQLQFDKNDVLMRHLNNGSDNAFSLQGTSNGYSYAMSVYALDWTDSKDVLFAPRVTTLNGETAVIKMVRKIFFPDEWDESDQTTSQSEWNNATLYSYIGPVPDFDDEPTEIGIQMVVKPEVDLANRTITMRMTPVVRQFIGWSTYVYEQSGSAFPPDKNGNLPKEVLREPIFADRVIDTLVTAKDGDTVVLGGIIRDETVTVDDKIPLLGDLPLVGRLFTSQSKSSKKVHMLIFMTCTLVNPDGSPYFPDSIKNTGKPIITEAL